MLTSNAVATSVMALITSHTAHANNHLMRGVKNTAGKKWDIYEGQKNKGKLI